MRGAPQEAGPKDAAQAQLASPNTPTAPTKQESSVLTLPTILTLTRVAAIPALIAVWFGAGSSAAAVTASIFLAACITDFLDGYLARKMGTHSAFGAFLDPVADKLMVSTVLILLSSKPIVGGSFAGNSWLMPTIASAIIGREIAMSALREWAASKSEEAHKAVAVSQLGKWKTTTQMVALTLLLFSSGGVSDNLWMEYSATLGTPLLLVATFLTVYSLYQYMRGLWKYLF